MALLTTMREEELLRLFIDQAPAAIAMFDRDMCYIANSRRWLADYGLGDAELRGRSYYEVLPDLPERWRELHRRALAGEVVSATEDRFDRADGTVRWLHWEVRPWYGEAGVGGLILFSEDITDRKRAEERFRIVVESSPVANVLVDEKGSIVLANRRAEELFGYSRDEMLGRPVEMLVPEPVRRGHAAQRDAFLAQPEGRAMAAGRELTGRCKDGRLVHVEVGLVPISSEQGRLVLASIIDLTERRELREQAIRDPLTGLFNRRFLEEALDREVSRASRARTTVGVLMLDMDRFKALNDRFGHAAGDAFLREVGRVIRENVRGEDVPCRYGGDEFVIVMPAMPLEDCLGMALRLQEVVKRIRPEALGAGEGAVGLSAGVAVYPEDGDTGPSLLRAVDAALYRAKAARSAGPVAKDRAGGG